jgi:outer membrane protein assembly factor BamD (BamD/ComL family)
MVPDERDLIIDSSDLACRRHRPQRSARTLPALLGRDSTGPLARLAFLLLLFPLTGCQTFSSPLSQWRAAYDGNLIRGPSKDEMADATRSTDSSNLLDRWLTPKRTPGGRTAGDGSSTLILGSDGWRPMVKPAKNPQADAELQAALKLFQVGKFADAQKQFAKIAKDRKGTPWGESGQYYLAETQYQRKDYVGAHENFERLMKDYTSATDFREKAVSREFAIARLWMLQGDPKAPPEKLIPWYGHFNGSLPLIDTQGSLLQVLEHVRQNDPSGPLADRASFEIAEHYMRHKDYDSAALYFDQFATEYPKSPLLQQAQHGAIDARLKGYLGPEYDASGLAKAREGIRKTLKTFPERQASFEGLYHTLDVINAQEAEKIYTVAMYYKRIGQVASAEYYLGKILHRWPETEWAHKAKVELAKLAKMPRTPSKPSKIIIPPGAIDPFGSTGRGMGGMGMGPMGMGMGMGGMGMGGMGGMM